MGRGKTTSHKKLAFFLSVLDFARVEYFTNIRGTAGVRGRVAVGLDTGSRLVVIDRVFTSIFCLC